MNGWLNLWSRSLGNSTMVGLCNHQQSTIQIKLTYHRRRKLVKLCLLTIGKTFQFHTNFKLGIARFETHDQSFKQLAVFRWFLF